MISSESFALQQFDEGTDLAHAASFQPIPPLHLQRRDIDGNAIEFRPGNHGLDLSLPDAKMADGSVAHVGTASRQAVAVVSKRFQVRTPTLAPKAAGDRAPFYLDWLGILSFPAQFAHLSLRLRASPCHRHIGRPLIVVAVSSSSSHRNHTLARSMSSETISSISSSLISVKAFSAPPSSRASAISCFSRIRASIFSSIVPRVTNLWTSTLRC